MKNKIVILIMFLALTYTVDAKIPPIKHWGNELKVWHNNVKTHRVYSKRHRHNVKKQHRTMYDKRKGINLPTIPKHLFTKDINKQHD